MSNKKLIPKEIRNDLNELFPTLLEPSKYLPRKRKCYC